MNNSDIEYTIEDYKFANIILGDHPDTDIPDLFKQPTSVDKILRPYEPFGHVPILISNMSPLCPKIVIRALIYKYAEIRYRIDKQHHCCIYTIDGFVINSMTHRLMVVYHKTEYPLFHITYNEIEPMYVKNEDLELEASHYVCDCGSFMKMMAKDPDPNLMYNALNIQLKLLFMTRHRHSLLNDPKSLIPITTLINIENDEIMIGFKNPMSNFMTHACPFRCIKSSFWVSS